jgi:Serine acetyltransferase
MGNSLQKIIKDDLYRCSGSRSFQSFLKVYFNSPGFHFLCWLRLTHVVRKKNKLMYILPKLWLRHLSYKYGFDIPAETIIGNGLYIGHFGGVVISSKAVIGENCNLSQNVTIGVNVRGKRKGYPIIKDNVYIGPGAVIIGGITIGNNVAIGANAVVLDNIPDDSVVVGVPGKVISSKGSDGYILNKV